MKLRHRPSPSCSEYLRKIKCDDWEDLGMSGSDKAVLRHRPTGETVTYATHDGGNEWNAARNMAARIQDLCGCRLIEPRGRKRSRKAVETSGFDIARASRESRIWHDAWGDQVAGAMERRDGAIEELRRLAQSSRPDIRTMGSLLAQVVRAEEELARFAQPVEPFDPNELASS